MILRAVFVTIAPERTADYWAWGREIVALWDSHGIVRHGGPFMGEGTDGEDTAVWLTLHDSEQGAEDEFRSMYGTPEGRVLLERRRPLVDETSIANYSPFTA
jgi:hypothetical protein